MTVDITVPTNSSSTKTESCLLRCVSGQDATADTSIKALVLIGTDKTGLKEGDQLHLGRDVFSGLGLIHEGAHGCLGDRPDFVVVRVPR